MKLKNRKGIKLFSRLVFRIYFYFGIVLVLFAVMLGGIFMNLYEQSTMESHLESIVSQADKISNKVSSFSTRNDKSGFDAYKDALNAVVNPETTDVWILANWNGEEHLDSRFTNAVLTETDLSVEVEEVLEKAFQGKTAYNQGYDDIYEVSVLRVATPVYNAGGKTVGAIMIMSMVQSQKNIINRSKTLIFISALAALSISIVIAFVFARQISKPIMRMRRTALELADGRYDAKTKIYRNDEIGDLARTLDVLSKRLKANEKERENMEQMRRDFFANVSHELRTPITVMLGYTEMLADGVVTEEDKKQQYYGRMHGECKSMERLVGDLLILSKMQNPDFEIVMEPVNLVQIFDELIRGVNVIASEKSIKVHFQTNSPRCLMMGDYDRLRQMFMVILDNAVKFSKEKGNIYINIAEMEKLKVEIRDEGIGIGEEDLPYIFDKFYKSKLRQNAKGSGLGLVIARQIAIRHGGKIRVESKEGIGTTFYFSFDKINPEML